MPTNPLDFLFNSIVMLFWIRAWDSRIKARTNPYFSAVARATDAIVEPLRAGLKLGSNALPPVAAVALLLVLRAAATASANPVSGASRAVLRFGFETIVMPGFTGLVLQSVLSFAVFLFDIWCFFMFFSWMPRATASGGAAEEFMGVLAMPLPNIKREFVPACVAALGFGIAAMSLLFGRGETFAFSPSPASALVVPTRYALSALLEFATVLRTARQLMIILIISSWGGLLFSSYPLLEICRDWLDYTLGPFRRFRLQIGFLDLTPIIALLAFGFAYQAIAGLLAGLYASAAI